MILMGTIGVLVIHGMGNQTEGYSKALQKRLVSRLRKAGVGDRVVFEEAHWSPVIEPAENHLYGRMNSHGRLRFRTLRRFIVSAFGDAIAYQPTGKSNGDGSTYHMIHDNVQASLDGLAEKIGPDAPLVVVAHSLGSIIASNMVWDAQHGRSKGTTPIGRFETLVGFVSFGSTLPLFTLRLSKIEMVQFPGTKVAAGTPLHEASRWLNLYDKHDVLGWPLLPIPNDAYNHDKVEDRVIDVGLLPWNFTPLSHSKYWSDKDFVAPVAELVAKCAHAAVKP